MGPRVMKGSPWWSKFLVDTLKQYYQICHYHTPGPGMVLGWPDLSDNTRAKFFMPPLSALKSWVIVTLALWSKMATMNWPQPLPDGWGPRAQNFSKPLCACANHLIGATMLEWFARVRWPYLSTQGCGAIQSGAIVGDTCSNKCTSSLIRCTVIHVTVVFIL